MASSLERAFRENRWTGIGAVAVIVGVVFAYASLRKQGAPVVIAGGTSDTSAGSGTSDLSAFSAGAAAAGSGFDTGAALGQGALGLAGSVVADFAGVSSTLAASQAQVAAAATSDLAGVLGWFVGQLQPDPGNPPPGATNPQPVNPLPLPPIPFPLPTPAPAPAPVPTPAPAPVRAWRIYVAPNTVVEYTSLNAAGALRLPWTLYRWGAKASSAPSGAPMVKPTSAGRTATVALVSSGAFAGKWVHIAGGVTARLA